LGLPESDFAAFRDYYEMSEIVDCMLDVDTSTPMNIAKTLAKAVFNEGVTLFASFIMLLSYQRFGKMKGMNTVVEWSLRDEDMHVRGVSRLFHEFLKENPEVATTELGDHIREMAQRVVELEDNFVDLAYGMGPVEGLKADEVKQYIRYIADRRMIQLGVKGVFNVRENPIPWVDWIINGADHSNFFEKRVTEYNVTGLEGDWGWED
jgi:glutaredoxin 3